MLKILATGNIGNDAKIQITNGKSAINFNIAETQSFKNADGTKVEKTTWLNCTIWKEQDKTNIAQFLKKGTRVLIEGTPEAQAYTKEGKTFASLCVNVTKIEFQGAVKTETKEATPATNERTPENNDGTDDLPF